MYTPTMSGICSVAVKKVALLRHYPARYLVAALLAGAYVGVGVFAVIAVGAPLAAVHSPWLKIVMGATFAVALSLVVFAGAELFTGNNLVLAVAWHKRCATGAQVWAIWGMSWLGNLLGGCLLAYLLYLSAVLNGGPEAALLQTMAEKKMHLPAVELLTRGALCNWLVCLAVWCTYRMKSESGKLLMIFLCLYAFVAAGFEHSVANMTLLSLALLQPHAATLSWLGMGHNLLWVTLGNIIGGAVFVGAAYLTVCTPDPAAEPLHVAPAHAATLPLTEEFAPR